MPSIQVLYINLHKMSTEFRVHCVVRVSFLSKLAMEGTSDMLYKNPYFFVTTEPNRMGFSPRCRYLVIVL